MRLCRAFGLLVFAGAVAQSSVTITWNTRAATPAPSPSAGSSATQMARVAAVHGTHVVLRMSDGTTRLLIATPAQARELEHLVGTAIRFRLTAGGK